ncbi:MAG: hypothetical protein HY660_12690 [Armatimonadetes bacterium]|nr:hypothetical protein [Armatimonadota bacterium]
MTKGVRDAPLSRVSRRAFIRAAGGVLLAPPTATLLATLQAAQPTRAASQATQAPQATPAPARPASRPGGTLTVAIGAEVSSLEPQLTSETSTSGIRSHMYDFLVWSYTPDGSMQPMLAAKWEADSNAMSYTFTLTDKPVKFHDGSPFTAESVKATFERLVAPTRASAAKNELDMIARVDIINPKTVKFTMTKPYALFARAVSSHPGAIMSAAAIAKHGENYGLQPVGSGPFKYVEYVKGDHLTLEKNPDYWGEPAKLDKIVYKIVPESSARVVQLETGESHVIDRVPITDALRLERSAKVSILRTTTIRSVWYYLNQNRPLMKDIRVRKAVNHAVDRESIIKNILRGYAVRSDSPVSNKVEFYAKQTPYSYDPARAKSLLKQAGVAEGTKLVIWTPQGRYVNDKEISVAVQSMLKKVGFDVELQAFGDFPTYLQALNTLQFDLALWGWAPGGGNVDSLQLGLHSRYARKFMNWASFNNPKVDEALRKAAAEVDRNKRAAYYAEAQKLAVEEAAFLLMHYQMVMTGVSKKVAGVYLAPDEPLILRRASFVS